MLLRDILLLPNMAVVLPAVIDMAAVIVLRVRVFIMAVQPTVVQAVRGLCLRPIVPYVRLPISITPYITTMCTCIPYSGTPCRSMYTIGQDSGATATAIGTTML